ncbi:MAG: type II toxin-antitoxin system VapC family toxin [Acidobacteriota bacterium]
MAVVVDASALAAMLFDEPEADEVRATLRGQALHAPALVHFELAHVAWKKLRRTPSRAAAILDALNVVPRLPLRSSTPDMVQVVALAAATGLTPYDASYLWLSKTLGLPLVTLDRALARAAESL